MSPANAPTSISGIANTLIEGVAMKKLTHITALIGVTACAAFAASALAAPASTTALFKATYAGKATEKVSGQIVTAAAKGAGVATVLGKSTIAGTVKGTTANPPCSPFGGPGTIKSSKGTLKVTVLNSSQGCAASESDQNNISLRGWVQVKGGTGKFTKARGKIHFTGHYDRSGGSFNVKLGPGKLTY
jgi:hypothetical protein